MRKKLLSREAFSAVWHKPRRKICPPPLASALVIRVSNNIVYLGRPKEGPKPRQLLSLPPFPPAPSSAIAVADQDQQKVLKFRFSAKGIIKEAMWLTMTTRNRGAFRVKMGQVVSNKMDEYEFRTSKF